MGAYQCPCLPKLWPMSCLFCIVYLFSVVFLPWYSQGDSYTNKIQGTKSTQSSLYISGNSHRTPNPGISVLRYMYYYFNINTFINHCFPNISHITTLVNVGASCPCLPKLWPMSCLVCFALHCSVHATTWSSSCWFT